MTFHHKKPSTTFCEILLTEILSDRQSFMTSSLYVGVSNPIINTETLIEDFFHGLLDLLRVLKLTAFLWSPYVIGQTIIFSSCFFLLSSSSSFFFLA